MFPGFGMVLIGIVIARVGAGDLDKFATFVGYFGTLTPLPGVSTLVS
jgi:hypothetical protein